MEKILVKSLVRRVKPQTKNLKQDRNMEFKASQSLVRRSDGKFEF